ncbi:MAG: D-alanyl-D-alanine carboxypeptidase [Clostridia bacterium]|nr:D-alanyl-D-alanine carboxypeptidase [Clostridia bacterium]MDE7328745.1 D-alanyl-D-alanine carboxypeptidase [Clostridia bacterium]
MRKKIVLPIIILAIMLLAIFPIGMASQTRIVAQAATATDTQPLTPNGFGEYLTEYYTGEVLYEHNAESKHEIASMVKIMTANLIFEAIDAGKISYDEMITISSEAASMGGSQMFLDSGAQYCISDLIKGIIVVSANDASYAMAERIAGSVDSFVNMMNERAAQLGMTNTKFANCTGLPCENEQYSCAKDVNIMTRQLMTHDKYFEYASVWMEDYQHPSGRITQFVNTNKLLKQYSGCIGGKTGYTDAAGHCLSACAERNGMKVVATIVGGTDSKSRFNQVRAMFDYSFANYVNKIYFKKGEVVGSVSVRKSPVESVEVATAADITKFSKLGAGGEEIQLVLPESIAAPITKGDVIGQAVYTLDGKECKVDLIAMQDARKSTFLDIIKGIAKDW